MLQLARNYEQIPRSRSDATSAPQLDLVAILRILRRRGRSIAVVLGMAIVLGGAYMALATRKYTSTFLVLVDPPKASLVARNDGMTVDRLMDPGIVESQVEVLKSSSVMRMVVNDLDLTHDKTVIGDGHGLISSGVDYISHLFSSSTTAGGDGTKQIEQVAIDNLQTAFKAQRVGVTYVLEGNYVNIDAERSAKIANGIANAYLNSQLDTRFQTNRRAAEWLQGRLKELHEQTRQAEFAVETYKAENGIVDTARGLITDAQLSDANTALAAAHNDTKATKADLDRVEEILKTNDTVNATVPDALKDDVLNRLRAQALDLSSRAADLSSRFGEQHGSVLKLRAQIVELNATARDELSRIKESLKSAFSSAAAKEEALREDLKTAVAKADKTSQAQVHLRDLESTAQTYRTLSDNMLDKLQEVTQEQTSPVDTARIIAEAAVPEKPSSPKLLIVMGLAIVGGTMFGGLYALLQEALGNGFKTPEDVQLYAGLECVGTLPRVKVTRAIVRSLRKMPDADKLLGANFPIARYSLIFPFSRFSETVRNVKVSIDIARGGKRGSITGVVSSVPKEGKTMTSANLALVTAQMGHRTLLIDGDLHNPSLTRTLKPDARVGLVEALNGDCSLEDATYVDPATGLVFLPAVIKKRIPNIVTFITSDAMKALLAQASETFEYVIVDLPPVVPVVDVRAAATLFDSFVFVMEWSRTSRDVVRDALLTSEVLREKIIGVVLNKAEVSELRRLEAYKGPAYDKYYHEEHVEG